MQQPRTNRVLATIVALVLATIGAAPVGASQPGTDTLSLVPAGTEPTNIDIAVTIARETFELSDTVLITRDDRFADALASGLLQSGAPLLMVPTDGPIPQSVSDEIADLGASRAIILGGVAAVSAAVEDELVASGLTVERREGGSRFETAIDVAASDAPSATTVMLARAFPSPGAPESQGFADTLAAGGVSAREGYPILLTETAVLTGATAQYLGTTPVDRVLVMGGTAAIDDAVTDELVSMGIAVERVAGATRDETAIEIAKISGDDSAADATRVIVTEGEGEDAWARGFALASHAAAFDAPIVLALADRIPASTAAFLSSGIGGDLTQTVMTCAVAATLCEESRVTAQLPPDGTESFTDVGPVQVSLEGTEVDRIEFEALAGERIGIGYRNFLADSPDEVICVNLVLIGPDGEQVAALDNNFSDCSDRGNAARGSTDSIALRLGGTYVLETSFEDEGAGSIEVFATAATDVQTEPGAAPTTIAQDRPGQVHRLLFDGLEGDQVSFGYRDFLPTEVGGGACVDIQLLSPSDNTVIGELSNGFTNCTDRGPTAGLEDAVVLPFDGPYVIETAIQAGTNASLDVFLNAVELADLTLGSAAPVELTRPGALHRGFFEGNAGQTITLSYQDLTSTDPQGTICVDIELINPSGTSEASVSNGFFDCTDRNTSGTSDPLVLPTTGTYILETSIDQGRSGSVSVQVQ